MERSINVLRLEVEGRWLASEFGDVLSSLSDLYDLQLFLQLLREDYEEWARYYPDFQGFSVRRRRRFAPRGFAPWAYPPFFGAPPVDGLLFSRVQSLVPLEDRLQAMRFDYASPGVIDLAGIGAVVGHVKDFVLKLIDRHDSKKRRKLEEDRAELENDRLRLENARGFVALARDLGYSEAEIRQLVLQVDGKQEALLRAIVDRRIVAVNLLRDASD